MQELPNKAISENTFDPQWIERLWAGDTTLWIDQQAHHFLGWMHLPDIAILSKWRQQADHFINLSKQSSFEPHIKDILLIGIGGSALGARALVSLPKTYRRPLKSLPTLTVLDTLDYETILHTIQRCSPTNTKIIVASKSGSTMEIMALYRFFRSWLENTNTDQKKSLDRGKHFMAITDPGSPLEKLAIEENFATTIAGNPSIGGRFSLFSPFGLFPAACVGIDIHAVVEAARHSQRSCQSLVLDDNQGAKWGIQLAAWKQMGKSLLQLVHDQTTQPFAEWLQQLIAESTGKKNHALLPFLSSVRSPICRGDDIATIDLNTTDSTLSDIMYTNDWPASCYSYCFSMAIYGLIRQFNPFDQPDVESTKQVMRQALQNQEPSSAHIPLLSPSALLTTTINTTETLQHFIQSNGQCRFIVLLDYLPTSVRQSINLVEICEAWRHQLNCPVFSVEGPAFLHSTGQLFKGAEFAKQGRYILLIDSKSSNQGNGTHMNIPHFSLDMASMRRLQALADYQVMRERHRQIALLDPPCLLSTCKF